MDILSHTLNYLLSSLLFLPIFEGFYQIQIFPELFPDHPNTPQAFPMLTTQSPTPTLALAITGLIGEREEVYNWMVAS